MRGLGTMMAISIAVTACAAPKPFYYANRASHSDVTVCRTWFEANKGSDYAFTGDVAADAAARGLDYPGCTELVRKQNEQAATGALVALAAIALVAVARSGSGGGGGNYTGSTTDYAWDWDQFYNDQYQLVWICRGVQTGQFAELSKCYGKFQTDSRWPSKQAIVR